MASEVNNTFESDDDDSDYVPSETELHEVSINEFSQPSSTDLKDIQSPKSCADDQKARTEKLWKDFLSDQSSCRNTTSISRYTENETTLLDYSKRFDTVTTDTERGQVGNSTSEKISSIADSVGHDSTVLNQSEVLKTEKEVTHTSLPNKRKKGISCVFESIKNKKVKETTLQKSLNAWNVYKKEEGIEEDLRTFNRGKGGFLNRKAFLERSDLRSFEVERAIRLSKK